MHAGPAPISSSAAPRAPVSARGLGADCADARTVLAAATGIAMERIFAQTRLEELISDSLVLETVVLELEDLTACEADRNELRKLETVEDLQRHLLKMQALTKI